MKLDKPRLLVIFSILIAIIGCYLFRLDHYADLASLIHLKAEIVRIQSEHPYQVMAIFFITYVLGTGLSLPVAGIMSILAGSLFGLVAGSLIVVLAGTTGASMAFLLSRYLFRHSLRARYSVFFEKLNNSMEKNGKIYLLSLRLFPAIPFFIINAVMGLTSMHVVPFFLISLFGMLPVTIILVNGGMQLTAINTVSDILSLKVSLSLLLIALLPLLTHKLYAVFARELEKT